MGSETRPHSKLRVHVLIALCGLLLVLGGMWLQSARAADDDGVRLSAADVGFAQDMSTHHEQALLIAQTLARDVDPQVRAFADQIVVAQTSEIATMHGWLTLFDQPFATEHPMEWMHGTDHHSGNGAGPMPGMASMDDITKLTGLRGVEAEVLFLQLMIRHHQGGVEMAAAATELVSASPIRRIAQGMMQDQSHEIAMMTAFLKARSGHPLPYP
jgi:uncharacterized protein (DUF305 family)